MWERIGQSIKTVGAAAIFAVVLAVVFLLKDSFLLLQTDGVAENWEYSLYAANSQAEIRGEVAIWELPFVEGKSVTVRFDNERSAIAYVEQLLADACVVQEEHCGDLYSIYAYASGRGKGVRLFGSMVNLHVARRGASVCVGSPMIFGGY